MINEKKIKNKLYSILEIDTSENKIPEYRKEEILELIKQNEFGIAFEVLAETFYEFEIKLTVKQYELFIELADKKFLNIDCFRYEFLKAHLLNMNTQNRKINRIKSFYE